MKIAGIIAEYNPFHNGHKYHIQQTREIHGATHIAVVMGGNFTQRGGVAVCGKSERVRAALSGGADLVVELPAAYSLGSAERFAFGGVSLISALGCDILSFGSECGDVRLLCEAAGASLYAQEQDSFFGMMRRGLTFPEALSKTIAKYYDDEIVNAFETPNNVLGIEYIKSLGDIGSSIQPVTIQRQGTQHDSGVSGAADGGINSAGGAFASAARIRELIYAGEDYSRFVPGYTIRETASITRLETAILAKLRVTPQAEIMAVANVTAGLDNRIRAAARLARNLDELLSLAKARNFTMARVRRAVLCCFLGITKTMERVPPPFIHILGMNERGREILSRATLPADTSLAKLAKISGDAATMAEVEARCGDLFALAYFSPHSCGEEFTRKAVIVS